MPRPTPDLAGQVFGRLTAVEPRKVGNRTHWLCRCDCGAEKVIDAGSLRKGVTRSCGCLHAEYLRTRERPATFRRKGRDLSGQRFGRLTVLELAPSKARHRAWKCLCDCGRETEVLQCNLVRSNTTSCGCVKVESAERLASQANTRTYPRRCRSCDKPFVGVFKQWFCSGHCAKRYSTEQRWPRVNHVCPVCQSEFLGRADRVYCSDRCSKVQANRDQYQRKHGSLGDQIEALNQALADHLTDSPGDNA